MHGVRQRRVQMEGDCAQGCRAREQEIEPARARATLVDNFRRAARAAALADMVMNIEKVSDVSTVLKLMAMKNLRKMDRDWPPFRPITPEL